MFGKPKNQNSNVWKSQNSEFQCLEKPKSILSKISSVNTRKDHNSIGAIGFKQVSMAVENASKTLVINMVSMIRKHITVDRV